MRLRILIPLVAVMACSSSEEAQQTGTVMDAAVTPTSDGAAAVDVASEVTATGSADAGDPKDAACTAMANADCKKREECGLSIIRSQFGTVANCVERRKIACLGSAAAPGSAFDPATVEACAKATAAETCVQASNGPHAKECAPTGSLDEGAPCGFSMQCKSGNCTLAGGTNCATCGKPFLPLDAPCMGFECEPGMQCHMSKCVRASGTDGPCSTAQPCWGGAVCVADKCVARSKKDESCATIDCDGRMGLVCVDASKICAETVSAKVDEACGPPSCGAAVCKPTSDAGPAGTCVARIPDGMPCDAASGIPCFQASACIAGKCTPFDATNCK